MKLTKRSQLRDAHTLAGAYAMDAVSDRTRSTARRCAIVSAQVVALPRAGSNREAERQTSSMTSWVTSSDWAGSRSTLRTSPKAGPERRS